MDITSDQHQHPCWICSGTGRANLLAGMTTRICAMCNATGMVATVPGTTGEMVEAMVSLPGVPRRKLTAEDEARIDAMEEIVRACLAEMEAEG